MILSTKQTAYTEPTAASQTHTQIHIVWVVTRITSQERDSKKGSAPRSKTTKDRTNSFLWGWIYQQNILKCDLFYYFCT